MAKNNVLNLSSVGIQTEASGVFTGTSVAASGVIYGAAANTVAVVVPTAIGQFIQSNGASAPSPLNPTIVNSSFYVDASVASPNVTGNGTAVNIVASPNNIVFNNSSLFSSATYLRAPTGGGVYMIWCGISIKNTGTAVNGTLTLTLNTTSGTYTSLVIGNLNVGQLSSAGGAYVLQGYAIMKLATHDQVYPEVIINGFGSDNAGLVGSGLFQNWFSAIAL